MTELASILPHADTQLTSTAQFAPSRHTANGYSPQVEEAPEDDSVIRCFCGISEDDGNTVLCEVCNTWQHILCYYPDGNVPDTHICVICEPRPHDRKGALERQQAARGLISPQERRIKKVQPKSHKKKVKDANSASVQTNGWLSGADGPDRGSGSPRDQGPPSKRPKTGHRSSASVSAIPHGSSRKRAGSATLNGQSPTKSPRSNSPEGYNGQYYTSEFMRSSNANYTTVTDNSYASISVSNNLRTWLNDTDSLKQISPMLTQKDVFTRWDRPIEALRQTGPGVSPCRREDTNIVINGQRPVHRWIEANTACGRDAYLGELNGHIGLVDDYYKDQKNRWDELRHPEPFVFFHDRLPIYVDCREEGNILRYVGRSCYPNVKLQIIIHGTDFHFCFISLREIAEGEELTMPWHLRGKELSLIDSLNAGEKLTPEDEANLSIWYTNLLANFGGCACARLDPHQVCALGRFDLRNRDRSYSHSAIKTKARKHKRLPTQISPGSTGQATNSRAGSEAVILKGDDDEEMADSRSLSANSRSQPSSRDITPMVGEGGIGLGVAMSDRERRKLLQQEKLFEKMELDGQGGRKGKRNSAGSALNTPAPTTSKQLGFPDSSNPSPTSANPTSSKPRANGSISRTNGTHPSSKPRPQMVSIPTQTDGDVDMTTPSPPRRRTGGSQVSQLLRRVQAETKRRKERSASLVSADPKASQSPPAPPKIDPSPPPEVRSARVGSDAMPAPQAQPQARTSPNEDVDMVDADTDTAQPSADKVTSPAAVPISVIDTAQPTMAAEIEPAPPPSPSDNPQNSDGPTSITKPTSITLPPVPPFPPSTVPDSSQTPLIPVTSTEAEGAAITDTVMTQSPTPLSVANPPALSPSVSASSSIAQPSPAKKKMSLGDYLKNKRKSSILPPVTANLREGDADSAILPVLTEEPKSDPVETGSVAGDDVKDVDTSHAPAADDAPSVATAPTQVKQELSAGNDAAGVDAIKSSTAHEGA